MVTTEGRVKVLDFGIAALIGEVTATAASHFKNVSPAITVAPVIWSHLLEWHTP
jgi:hypothetical protein